MHYDSVGVHLRILIFNMLPDAIQERVYRIATTKGYSTSPHKTSIGDGDLQGLADTGQSTIAESHGKTGQALHELGRTKHFAENILFLGEFKRQKSSLGKFGVRVSFRSLGIALGQQ
jgi:hypothetical protein